jgi:F0F1-type ATP synthase membrane subunit c/vacuolar-type H+-ATPase subunit K
MRMNLRRSLRIHKGAWFIASSVLFAAGLCARFTGKWDGLTVGSLWVQALQNPDLSTRVLWLVVATLYSGLVLLAAIFAGWLLQYFVVLAIKAFKRKRNET